MAQHFFFYSMLTHLPFFVLQCILLPISLTWRQGWTEVCIYFAASFARSCSMTMTGSYSGSQILCLELPYQASTDSRLFRMATQLQICVIELNVCGKLCHYFHQYLAIAGFLYRIFDGHRTGDVTSMVSDPPFINLVQKSDSDEEPMLIG